MIQPPTGVPMAPNSAILTPDGAKRQEMARAQKPEGQKTEAGTDAALDPRTGEAAAAKPGERAQSAVLMAAQDEPPWNHHARLPPPGLGCCSLTSPGIKSCISTGFSFLAFGF